MKAIVTAGGRGTRLRPITWTLNKHLIPLANEPMLANAFKKIAAVGITEIAVNINPGDKEIEKHCGDGSRWGVHLTYIEQDGGAVGVGQIVVNAKDFIGDDDVLLYFGDNIVLGSLEPLVKKFKDDNLDCCLAFSRVPDPQRFGVPSFDEHGKLIGVIEKPEHPASDLAQTGIFVYKMAAHVEAFANIKPSPRGEYEISDINDWLISHGRKVGYVSFTGWWKDTGKPEDLLEGNQLLLNEITNESAIIDESLVKVDDTRIQGRVKIGKNVVLGKNVLIRGPVVIGDDVHISDSYIGPHTTIGNDVHITNTEVEHTIVLPHVVLDAHTRIVDSIVGEYAVVKSDKASLPVGHRIIVGDHSYLEL